MTADRPNRYNIPSSVSISFFDFASIFQLLTSVLPRHLRPLLPVLVSNPPWQVGILIWFMMMG